MGICGSKDTESYSNRNTSAQNTGSTVRKSGPKSSSSEISHNKSNPTAPLKSNEKFESFPEPTAKQQLQTVAEGQETTVNTSSNPKQSNVMDSTDGSNNSKNDTVEGINKLKYHAKVLLLGSGESGKSTILRQIKIIHQNGFTDDERKEYKPFVFQNIVESIQCITKALVQYNLKSQITNLTGAELEFLSTYELPYSATNDLSYSLDGRLVELTKKLVTDEKVEKLLSSNEYEFYLLDSASYFFENLDRIGAPDYIPTTMDILRTRTQTSGIFDTKFQMEDLEVHLYDVGGQRSERKKWIHCFDNVTAIIFCVSLSEYNQTLLESPTQNRLEESLNLFESVVNSMWFKKTAVILCLNKIDIFIDQLPNYPLENYFPDYVGGANVNKAVKYILWRFKQLNRANLNLVPYVTQATDTNNIKLAFAIVRETILHKNLLESGVITS